MSEIRLQTLRGTKIYLDDRDDYVLVNFDDLHLVDKFENIHKQVSEVAEKTKNGEALSEEELDIKICDIAKELEGIFGEGSIKKLFGTDKPSPYAIAVIIERFVPIINDVRKQRESEIMSKYNSARGHRNRYKKGRKGR